MLRPQACAAKFQLLLLQLAVAVVMFLAVASHGHCATNLDCELLGACQPDGTCACAPGFTGPSCGQLDVLPVDAATHGRVWPVALGFPPYSNGSAPPARDVDGHHEPVPSPGHGHGTIGWSFAPQYNPATKRWVAAVEAV